MKAWAVLLNLLLVWKASTSFVFLDGSHQHHQLSSTAATRTDQAEEHASPWLSHGLLISSFNDGLRPNTDAHDFLRRGLVRSVLSHQQQDVETKLEASAVQSPCCGPDVSSLSRLEQIDQSLEKLAQNENDPASCLLDDETSLRFLYIPTAMYALRADSTATPGKQRQRARADGKKRRNEIVKLMNELLPSVSVLAATLDLDDGSVKQCEGSEASSAFPTTGQGAVRDWRPHFVYVEGGNTFWLWHCIEKGNWKDALVKTLTGSAVYCGSSAGAIVCGQSIETACWKGWDDPSIVPDRPTYEKWRGVSGLGLVGSTSFFPHMEDQWCSLAQGKQQDLKGELCCLRDDEVYCVDGFRHETFVVSSPETVLETAQ